MQQNTRLLGRLKRYLFYFLGLVLSFNILMASAEKLDQDDVLTLVEQAEILPLKALLARHKDKLQGRIIDLELERELGQVVYELKLMDSQGVVREYLINAKTGLWLGEEAE